MQTIQEIEIEANAQVVARGPKGEPFTRQRLRDLFNVVASPENWKFRIDTVIDLDPADRDAMREAVIFFTGSVPTFSYTGNGIECAVKAAGYYATIGA